ncbi:MAG: hypothetical protein MMC23_007152 [Stictis urceolatum]|nr:hypothetical protein [Stictis urceolata]
MATMLLTLVPPAGFHSPSPVSPCSNPFSTSFAAFLRPVFNTEDDLTEPESGSSSRPIFAYPWLKPSPLNFAPKKALPPIPTTSASPNSTLRREPEPVVRRGSTPIQRERSAGTFAECNRRSRYDSVPNVQVPQPSRPQQQSPRPQQQSLRPSRHSPKSDQSPRQPSPEQPSPLPRTPRAQDPEDEHKLDLSIAMSGIELDMSSFSSFTPRTSSSSDSFSSSVSSIFDAPEALSLRSQKSSVESLPVSPEEVGEESMLVPLVFELDGRSLAGVGLEGGREREREGRGEREREMGVGLGLGVSRAEGEKRRWPRRLSSVHGRKGSQQREVGLLPSVREA